MNSSVREKPSKKCGNACGKIIRSIFWNKIIIQNIEVINIYKYIKPWEKPWESFSVLLNRPYNIVA